MYEQENNQIQRISKHMYYLDIAKSVAQRGTCIRRNYGSIIVKDDLIVSTGYTGSPRGCVNCCDAGKCARKELNIPPGERYELCSSVHSEQNAIISANRRDMLGAILYLYCVLPDGSTFKNPEPCLLCKKMILNSRISEVITLDVTNMIKIVKTSEYVKILDDIKSI